jgi:hypothetical protein
MRLVLKVIDQSLLRQDAVEGTDRPARRTDERSLLYSLGAVRSEESIQLDASLDDGLDCLR